MLPDVALLDIFEFYLDGDFVEAWHTLVHVCRKWRTIVFGSPRRLNLRLSCGYKTRVREMLDIWPPFPIIVGAQGHNALFFNNISAALEFNDRICELYLTGATANPRRKALASMRRPFPLLVHLHVESIEGLMVPVNDLDPFLGGSAPHLKSLFLKRLPVPGLPNLLSSATHLVRLDLYEIPYSGYISPEAMLTALSTLTNLEGLTIEFESRPGQNIQCSLPQTRILLPVLTQWRFRGVSEYSEVLMSSIDAPILDKLRIIFIHRQTFYTSKLTQFISRTPKFKAHNEVHMAFSHWVVSATLPQISGGELELGVVCKSEEWGPSSLAQICSSSLPQAFIPAVEHFYFLKDDGYWDWDGFGIENSQWLELFHSFTAVKYLYLSLTRRFASHIGIALALQELVGERVTEVLPSLETLFLEERLDSGPILGAVQESIDQFVAARKLAGYIVTVSRWERDTNV
jgi:hypothetical protein